MSAKGRGRKSNLSEVVSLYQQGLRPGKISKQVGISKYMVCRHLKDAGLIELNPYNNQSEDYDQKYFSTLTEHLSSVNQRIARGAWL